MPHGDGILVTRARLHNGEEVKIFNLRPHEVQILIEEGGDEKLLCVDGDLKEVSINDIEKILGESRTDVRFILPEFRQDGRRRGTNRTSRA